MRCIQHYALFNLLILIGFAVLIHFTFSEPDAPFCGRWCVRQHQHNGPDESRSPSRTGCGTWTPSEISMFQVLAPLYLPVGHAAYHQYTWCCTLARLLGTKTCSEVSIFSNTSVELLSNERTQEHILVVALSCSVNVLHSK